MKQRNDYAEFICLLQELKKQHPTYTVAQHLSTAFDSYGNFWGLTDKESLFALEKYKAEIDLDRGEQDIEKIIKDGQNLFTLEEEDY